MEEFKLYFVRVSNLALYITRMMRYLHTKEYIIHLRLYS